MLSGLESTDRGVSRHEFDEVFRIIAGLQDFHPKKLLLLLNGVHELLL